MIYLYARVSTDKQENGREAQTERLLDWCGDREHVLFIDEDVSAHSVPLKARPNGKLMWDLLAPGDTVVFSKTDRAFRSLADAAPALQVWHQMGIAVRILDLDIDLSTPAGELFFSQLVAFAQFESRMHGQRKREVYAHKRLHGLPYSRTRPFGWVAVKGRDGRLSHWAPCEAERELAAVVRSMHAKGWNWCRISTDLCLQNVTKPGRKRGLYYRDSDLPALVAALEAGFPKRPQGELRGRGSSRKQRVG